MSRAMSKRVLAEELAVDDKMDTNL
jgi:hypothetical protein